MALKALTKFMVAGILACASVAPSFAADKPPHGQDRMPGPALKPDEFSSKFKLPPGFKLQVCAAEPDIVNPTSMTFDDRGRIWVTESVEYPRPAAGVGKDRIKILESTKNDGVFDKVTIFKDGLNIPCGVLIGNGGVYVTNSPDIVFMQDTNGDGVCDKEEVILTGFGRADRHELPNSLTWGPDGWLYGLNGVFNGTTVVNDGQTFKFTCALWRWHPKTKKFELFAEGTSNPWGLDYNAQGDWFISCCVIDHLFHLTQSGYYHRQGGPYPQFTHKIGSITTQKHQKAAYAGLCIYQGDAYPKEYQNTLIMGNLHGSALNQDLLKRNGSTYKQTSAPDFANIDDAWFMPVSQKVGPDGCIYVMDWYDRYHCYQDSGKPDLDRTMGRIYRITYNDTPFYKPFDLSKLSNDELLKLLGHPNVWQRRTAQRILNEKFDDALGAKLQEMALNTADTTEAKRHALWILCSQFTMDPAFHDKLLSSADPVIRNWGVRMVGQMQSATPAIIEKLKALANDPVADVRLQVVIAAGRMTKGGDPFPVFNAILANEANAKDPLIPFIIYNNLKPLAGTRAADLIAMFDGNAVAQASYKDTVIPWLKEVINSSTAGGKNADGIPWLVAADVKKLAETPDLSADKAAGLLNSIGSGLAAANLKPDARAKAFDPKARGVIVKFIGAVSPAQVPATVAALAWKEPAAQTFARTLVADAAGDAKARAVALRALGENNDEAALKLSSELLFDTKAPMEVRKVAAEVVQMVPDSATTSLLIEKLVTLPNELQMITATGLTRNEASASALLTAIAGGKLPKTALNTTAILQLQSLGNAELTKKISAIWGVVKAERNPERVAVIAKMKEVVAKTPSDAKNGYKVFQKNCMVCHQIYGKGNDIGPDLTGVGRESVDAILNNVLDPNLIVGDVYLVHMVKTKAGKVATGVLSQETPQKIVLKQAGNVLETIMREDVEKHVTQPISLMPEGLEKQMTEKEFCDLVSFLLTTEPPQE